MEQTENLIEYIQKHLTRVLSVLTVALQSCLNKLNVPVAVTFPYKLVNLLNGNTQLKLVEVLVYLFCNGVER